MANIGKIIGVNSNLLRVRFEQPVVQNEVAFALLGNGTRLKSEVIRVRGSVAELQVFEDTTGLKEGDSVEFTGSLLSVELGPGLLTQVFDGLQNPLPQLAEKCGFFLQRGEYLEALPRDKKWAFTPSVNVGDKVSAGDSLGSVPEGIFKHQIMVPFRLQGTLSVESIAKAGEYKVLDVIATLKDQSGKTCEAKLMQTWPVKLPIKCYSERLRPVEPLITKQRIVDTFFPVNRGGVYCIPGPFGAGKTVLQQLTARHAEVDIVIITACGERAGEVVETLKEFPEQIDPRTGKSLMERTLIICNTSSMPVAAREASVYTGVTLAEYYRQMGLNVLLLADSTSRWAQALREMSGRLEEIPGEEAFPAYLESVIASFYERGGIVRLKNGSTGSVTIGGTVSPAGGNFEEPVTQATLKVVGAFHGLSRERSDQRRFPAIHPLDSWAKYRGIIDPVKTNDAHGILRKGNDVGQMMKVVGEEGTSMDDFVLYLKGEFLDSVYLQQDAYHKIDEACPGERQEYVFQKVYQILKTHVTFSDKDTARSFFLKLTQTAKDWNRVEFKSKEFEELEANILKALAEVTVNA
ncbi:MAG: V-type ATP synthase subunit A [Fibromonadales bacterium]|nr:V-type ATP synthase subunit A [Fibromonadales bacterium]